MVMHRTAMGRSLDMGAMRQKNQHVRAVGNMNVDAAGNTLDSNNKVIEDGSRRVNRVYNRAAQNPSAQARAAATNPTALQAAAAKKTQAEPQAKVPAAPTPAPAAVSRPAPPPAPVAAPMPDIVQPEPIVEDEISEVEYLDLSEYDIEEPVGKETPKKK